MIQHTREILCLGLFAGAVALQGEQPNTVQAVESVGCVPVVDIETTHSKRLEILAKYPPHSDLNESNLWQVGEATTVRENPDGTFRVHVITVECSTGNDATKWYEKRFRTK